MPHLSRPGPSSSSALVKSTLAQAARLATAALNKDQRSQAAQTLVALAGSVESGSSDGLESWLGPGPADPVSLELRSLMQRFELRRQQLRRTIGADQVADLLQTRSRQTPHDRAKAGTLLAIRENGRLRFPLCQFDPEGHGVTPNDLSTKPGQPHHKAESARPPLP